jgi:hypothetical protein
MLRKIGVQEINKDIWFEVVRANGMTELHYDTRGDTYRSKTKLRRETESLYAFVMVTYIHSQKRTGFYSAMNRSENLQDIDLQRRANRLALFIERHQIVRF